MNEKPDPRARLVAETFTDDWGTGPAAGFALAAAALARRRRRLHRTLQVGAAVALAFASAVFLQRVRTPAVPPVATAAPRLPIREAASAPKISPAFEIISDEQLFAELRGRPLLILPQSPDGRRIVLLDR